MSDLNYILLKKKKELKEYEKENKKPEPEKSRLERILETEKQKKEPQKRNQTKRIYIRLTEEEYNLIMEKVKESGLSQREFLLKSMTYKPIFPKESLREFLKPLLEIRTSLNVISKFTENKRTLPEDFKNILQEIRDLCQFLK